MAVSNGYHNQLVVSHPVFVLLPLDKLLAIGYSYLGQLDSLVDADTVVVVVIVIVHVLVAIVIAVTVMCFD